MNAPPATSRVRETPPVSASPAVSRARRWIAPVVLVLVALALSAASLELLASDAGLERLRAWRDPLGIWAGFSFALLAIPAIALGLPRSLCALLAGALFGAVSGAALATLASFGGCALSFMTVRLLDTRPRVAPSTRWPRLSAALAQHGVATVLGLRLVPVGHCQTLNVLLALSRVSTRAFLLGTALGILPQAVAFALLGAGVIEGAAWPMAAGSALILAAAALGWRLSRSAELGVFHQEGSEHERVESALQEGAHGVVRRAHDRLFVHVEARVDQVREA